LTAVIAHTGEHQVSVKIFTGPSLGKAVKCEYLSEPEYILHSKSLVYSFLFSILLGITTLEKPG